MPRRRLQKWCAPGLFLLSMTACAGGGAAEMNVEQAWALPSPQAAQNNAFYMTITNNTGRQDALLAVRAEACGAVELHRSTIDEEGVMRMAPVPGGQIVLAPGETVTLAPGGLHVMCVNVAEPLQEGDRIPLTLVFEEAGDVSVTVDVRGQAP